MKFYTGDGNAVNIGEAVVNVASFGATGNGTTNDTLAIQNAIDSIKNTGGTVFFPYGTYRITSSLIFYSNQTLYFEKGATLLQGSSINNMLRTFCDSTISEYNGVHDCVIYGATFDGGSYTGNNTLVATVHAKNIIFENCIFKNGYGEWHNLEINSSCNVKVINCSHEGSRRTSTSAEMIQIDVASGSGQYPWDNINADNTVCKYIEISGCSFMNSEYSPAIGCHNGTPNFISIHDNVFDDLTSSRGAINLQSADNVDIHDNTFNGCTTGIGSSGATYYIHDNRFVSCTTAISGSASVAHANMINGTYTA